YMLRPSVSQVYYCPLLSVLSQDEAAEPCHILSALRASPAQTLFDVAQHIVDILKAQHIVDKRWEPYDAAAGGSVEWMDARWRDCWQWSGIGGESGSRRSVGRCNGCGAGCTSGSGGGVTRRGRGARGNRGGVTGREAGKGN